MGTWDHIKYIQQYRLPTELHAAISGFPKTFSGLKKAICYIQWMGQSKSCKHIAKLNDQVLSDWQLSVSLMAQMLYTCTIWYFSKCSACYASFVIWHIHGILFTAFIYFRRIALT